MQLVPYFQPIVDISNARVVGHEALARLVDAEGNIGSAAAIFCNPDMDEKQLLELDRQVREKALAEFAAAGQPGFLTLNITPRWIDKLGVDSPVPTIEMMQQYHIDPSRIVVEIIETQSHTDHLLRVVKQYRQHGIRVAVDDFGAGSSQFDRVVRLEPDIVKLDMGLLRKAVQGGFSRHLVQSLSYLAERMGSQVLCEGVEDYRELRFALEIGSKLIQGFMFSEAAPAFTEASSFGQSISIQRKRFLLEGIRREELALEESRNISAQIDRLRELLQHKPELDKTDLQPLNKAHISSLFICDLGGNQLSPTWRHKNGKWFACPESIGTNWCWRPYFYQLFSNPEAMQEKCITSRQYHDAYTGVLVKTTACFIGQGRVLMVDINIKSDTVTV